MRLASITVPSRVEFVRPATTFLVQAARALDVPAADDPVFEVALSEAITNAVRHGGTPTPEATVTCEIERGTHSLTVRVLDDGEGFHPAKPTLPDVSRERLEAIPASGYGLPIIHTVFNTVRAIEVEGRFGVELELAY